MKILLKEMLNELTDDLMPIFKNFKLKDKLSFTGENSSGDKLVKTFYFKE